MAPCGPKRFAGPGTVPLFEWNRKLASLHTVEEAFRLGPGSIYGVALGAAGAHSGAHHTEGELELMGLRRIKGCRGLGLPGCDRALEFWLGACAEVLGALLAERNLLCPGYEEIYFKVLDPSVGPSASHPSMPWYREVEVVLGLAEVQRTSCSEQVGCVMRGFGDAFRELAERDGLETDTVAEVVQLAVEQGLGCDLLLRASASRRYRAAIHYRVAADSVEAAFTLSVTRVRDGQVASRDLGVHDPLSVGYVSRYDEPFPARKDEGTR